MNTAEITVPPVDEACAEISELAKEAFGAMAALVSGRLERALKHFCSGGGVLAKFNPDASLRMNGKVCNVKGISFFPLVEGTEVLLSAAERDGVPVAFFADKIKGLVEHCYLNHFVVGMAHDGELRDKLKSVSDAGQTVVLVMK